MDKENSWSELKDKEIVSILDGDTELIQSDNLTLNMPHLTAKDIVYGIGRSFKYYIPLYDDNKLARSRWKLFFDLLDNATKYNQTKKVLELIFDKRNFRKYIEDDLGKDVSSCRKLIPLIQKEAIDRINDILYTKDLKLTYQLDLVPLNTEIGYIKAQVNLEDKSEASQSEELQKGFYILPFKQENEDMMKAIQMELNKKKVNLDLVKAGDIFDCKYQNNIVAEIKDSINNAKVIITDISDINANVYFELGIAMASNKNLIMICNGDTFDENYKGKLPLDISTTRVIFYKRGFQTEMEAADKIAKEIGSILDSKPVKID